MPAGSGLPHDSDAQRVDAVRSGDEHALEALFHDHYAALCRFVERYVESADAAEEIVQQLFVRIWDGRRTWIVRGTIKPYLYQAARNAALNWLKHERVRRSFAERVLRLERGVGSGQPPPDPEAQHEARELAALIARAFAKLPEHYREVVQMRARDRLTHAEISRILDLPLKTVETRARRGLQALRRLLSPHL